MSITAIPYDTQTVAESQWNAMATKLFTGDGIIPGELLEFEAFGDSSGMQVKVRSGRACVHPQYMESTATETVAVTAAHATLARIDRVVLHNDFTANACTIIVLAGTAAGSPTAPALTQSGTVWELSLAQIEVQAAVSTITVDDITDERSDHNVCGWAHSLYPVAVSNKGLANLPTSYAPGGLIYSTSDDCLYINRTDDFATPDWVRLIASDVATPSDAPYVTTAAAAILSNEQVLGTSVIMSGLLADRPAFGTAGRLYLATDDNTGTTYRDSGTAWVQMAAPVNAGGGGGAPSDATFVTLSLNSGLSAEAALGASVIMSGTAAARPAAATAGLLYFATDTDGGTLYRDTGAAWVKIAAAVNAAGAPTDATYVTLSANGSLSAESVLGSAVVMAGTLAARPAAATAGLLYLATDVAGGTLYRDSGSAWVAAGAGVTTSPSLTVVKTADQSATLDGLYVNDNKFIVPVLASEVWAGHLALKVTSASATPDMRVGFTIPTGGALEFSAVGPDLTVSAANPSDTYQREWIAWTGATVSRSVGLVAGTQTLVLVYFTYVGGGNAGNITFQFAQNTVDAVNAVTVKAFSHLVANRV